MLSKNGNLKQAIISARSFQKHNERTYWVKKSLQKAKKWDPLCNQPELSTNANYLTTLIVTSC